MNRISRKLQKAREQSNRKITLTIKVIGKILESPAFTYQNQPNDIEKIFELKLLGFFTLDDTLRKTHCPDCMFHSNYDGPKFEKSDLVGLSRRLVLNDIQIDKDFFEFSCMEAGISCEDLWGRNYRQG